MNKRTVKSAETRQNNDEATKNAWADPAKPQRRIEAINLALIVPERAMVPS